MKLNQKMQKKQHSPLNNVPFAKIWQMGHFSVANVPFLFLHFYRPQTKFAKVMFLQVSVHRGGDAWLLRGGACVVARGGLRGCSGGACVVAPGGVCVVFSMRYGQ